MVRSYAVIVLLCLSPSWMVALPLKISQMRVALSTSVFASTRNERDEAMKEGQRIEKLLMTALKVAQGISDSSTSKSESRLGMIDMSFTVRHKEKIDLKDSTAAHEYLSLPVSQYSLLSSNIVTRVGDSDLFRVSVPIPARTTSLNNGMATDVEVKASADVMVKPYPDSGEVVMESGPIYLQTSQTQRRVSYDECENDPDDEAALRSILPAWLLSSDDMESTFQDGDDPPPSAVALKSSIQAGFSVKLRWNPPQEVLSLQLPSEKATNDGTVAIVMDGQTEKETLPVKAEVKVWVDLRLPIRNDISRAVNFPPVKLLLSQAGRLITRAVIKGLAPTLISLLEKDYAYFREGTGRENFNNSML